MVGHKLWKLTDRHQVLCITHLAQLAAFGQQHYQVHKLIEDGRNGFKLPPDNADVLADLLNDLSSDPRRVRSLRANALESARGGTVERMVDDYLQVYEFAAGQKGRLTGKQKAK